jgi:hypothetical protein
MGPNLLLLLLLLVLLLLLWLLRSGVGHGAGLWGRQ